MLRHIYTKKMLKIFLPDLLILDSLKNKQQILITAAVKQHLYTNQHKKIVREYQLSGGRTIITFIIIKNKRISEISIYHIEYTR